MHKNRTYLHPCLTLATLFLLTLPMNSCGSGDADDLTTTTSPASAAQKVKPIGPHPEPLPDVLNIRTTWGGKNMIATLVIGTPGTVAGAGSVTIENVSRNKFGISTPMEVLANEEGSFLATILAQADDVLAFSYKDSDRAFLKVPTPCETHCTPPPSFIIKPIPTLPLMVRSALDLDTIIIRGQVFEEKKNSTQITGILAVNLDQGQVNAVGTYEDDTFQIELKAAPQDQIMLYKNTHPLMRGMNLIAP